MSVTLLEEKAPAGRLGRHVEHDPASLSYGAERSSHLVTTLHKRDTPVLDQGQLGSCTGNAITGLLGTEPFYSKLQAKLAGKALDEAFAVAVYEAATKLDGIPGSYPPQDTGSSGLAVAKAVRALGLIGGYRHAFGLAHALAALVVAPVIIGIPWYDSFDKPGPGGLLSISANAGVRGGHELELLGLDVTADLVRGVNSWGPGWADQGHFCLSWTTFGRLLSEQGDVTTITL